MAAQRSSPLRLLTAVPICDGHDSAIVTINLELIRQGIEIVYLGYHRSARAIVQAAIQEDVRAIGISSYNGGHCEFFEEVIGLLKAQGAHDIGVFGGGGGTITEADAKAMYARGVDRIFFAGSSLAEMVEFVVRKYGGPRAPPSIALTQHASFDLRLAQLITATVEEADVANGLLSLSDSAFPIPTLGFTGPGGVGKTTLIDELVLRHLKAHPTARIAILSHDPSIIGKGALLGDRTAMIHAQDDRVFMRSLASRGQAGGLAEASTRWLEALKRAKAEAGTAVFDLILIETVGIGQEATPFQRPMVDKIVLVMGPDYGSRLQLQKIAMLDVADAIVINKADRPGASTAQAELKFQLSLNGRGQRLIATIAKQHRNPGVDALYRYLCEPV
ncbi:MAG: cobalamin-dependent protein [Gammaproteobacteria bacterium]